MIYEKLTITDLTEAGNGVARHKGKVLFVEGAIPGEIVDVEILQEKKKYDTGRIRKIRSEVAGRQESFCPHYGVCGGCSLQHIRYEEGLSYKARWVRGTLAKIANIQVPLPVIIGMKGERHYRNKVTFHGFFHGEGYALGFYRKNSQVPLPIRDCALLPAVFLELKKKIEELANLYNCYPPEVVLRTNGKEIGVHMEVPCLDNVRLVEDELKRDFPGILVFSHQEGEPEEGILEMPLSGRSFLVSPASFFQVNQEGAEALVGVLRDLFPKNVSQEKSVLYDLYCGVGSLGISLGDLVRGIRGYEVVEPAVVLARENARRNGLVSASFESGKVEDLIGSVPLDGDSVVLLDPPRAGVEPRVISALLRSGCPQILYVGCGLGKMVRDIAHLAEGGYLVKAVVCVDMFPWTGHVETVVLMERK